MFLVVRYFLVFAFPLLTSALLFYGSLPLRAAAEQISTEWISLALSSSDEARAAAFASIENGELSRIFNWLSALAIGTVLLTSCVCALIVPPEYSPVRKLNLLTAMIAGLCAANLVIGFSFMSWPEFAKSAAGGVICAGSIIWLRTTSQGSPIS